jgi:hypothetical protein
MLVDNPIFLRQLDNIERREAEKKQAEENLRNLGRKTGKEGSSEAEKSKTQPNAQILDKKLPDVKNAWWMED